MDDVRQAIETLTQTMTALFRCGYRREIAQFYTEDGFVLGPCGQQFRGREAIAQYWSSFFTARDWRLEIVRLEGSASLALQEAHSTITHVFDGETVSHTVDVLLLWKRQSDGSYRIATDCYL